MAKRTADILKKGGPPISRIVYIFISLVYLLVVVGATAYSLTAYEKQLPLVELVRIENGRMPKDCLYQGADSMVFCTVEQQDGPWGKRYVVKQVMAYNYQEIDEGTMFVYDAVSTENPIVKSPHNHFLHDGMEVRIS